jgi:hypothetical protein
MMTPDEMAQIEAIAKALEGRDGNEGKAQLAALWALLASVKTGTSKQLAVATLPFMLGLRSAIRQRNN